MIRRLVALIALSLFCSKGSLGETVSVGSKAFTESRVLAEVLAQLVEAQTEIKVTRKTNLGGTIVVLNALKAGEIDFYVDYTGTGYFVHNKLPAKKLKPLQTFLEVKKTAFERDQIVWLDPLGFNNTYGVAVRKDIAKRYGLSKISDLRQKPVKIASSHEFVEREDGYRSMAMAYQFELSSILAMEHGLAYEAISKGKVDGIVAYSTDGKLKKYDLTVLEDDLGHFPPYHAAVLIRNQTLQKYPNLREVLNRLATKIDSEKMQELNLAAEENPGSYAQVASNFLKELKDSSVELETGAHTGRSSLGTHFERVIPRFFEHVWITLAAVLLAVLISIPFGIYLTRNENLASAVLGVLGVIQTIPSLALLALFIPVLGLGYASAILALFLYSLLPMVRNTYTGLKEVESETIESAYAIGLTQGQVLMKIQLPLATRTIMAGVRTATIISIGVATLAAFIGAGGLGDLILTGLQLNDIPIVLSGAIPAALLALVADFGLARLEHALTPRGVKLSNEIANQAASGSMATSS